jgi:tRNA G18 (ribose-2'-O)-methylase SpoU
MPEMSVLLHNVRSAHNVGSVFRTADAAGVSTLYLTGYTPVPASNTTRAQKDIAKTALGAQMSVPWEHAGSPSRIIARLREAGWRIVGVEQDARALDYRALPLAAKTLFIFGNEVRGLSKPLCDACDVLVEIPMRGKKESLNVSVAAGIVLFAALPQ